MNNDLTFFTNETNSSLLERFKSTLTSVQYFDVLVGYFRTTGFHLLQDALEDIESIRILVGLSVDRTTYEIIDSAGQHQLQESTKEIQDDFAKNITAEMETSEDTYETEAGVRKFIEFIRSGKLEIKAHPSQNIHAKVYISRYDDSVSNVQFGNVITGSSNFSYSGLKGQYEFNVELKDKRDVDYALEKFETLWLEGVELSEKYIDTINNKTWLNNEITPYEIYLKFLYEYFKEDINQDNEFDSYLPDGFLELKYQKQAVISAKKILDAYNGVFLADVVGLGKTYISAMLAQQLPGRKLVICPPVLKDYWERTFREFNVAVKVESMGKLDHIIDKMKNESFEYIFIDEAHRFRNEGTQGYEKLHQICFGKKIILVSATPLNNRISDIFAQLKLFQVPKNSIIPGVPNLERFFSQLQGTIDKEEKGTPKYIRTVKDVAQEVRDKVLKYVMVRRTRNEIVNYFSEDIATQGLFFPVLQAPQRIIYAFDDQTDRIFTETIQKLRTFKYSRYTPLLYTKKQLTAQEQSQRNVGGFMKGILVKRLESSFYAFKRSLERFIRSYERFIGMYEDGMIYISNKVNVYDLLEQDNEESLLKLIEDDRISNYPSHDFKAHYIDDLNADLELLKEIYALWQATDYDPKIEEFITQLKSNHLLKNKQVIIFTESTETAEHLYRNLNQEFDNEVMRFSSGGGFYRQEHVNITQARNLIQANYDPREAEPQSDIRILITTDVLAEGINLHRSNIVINYDLPWNPTRVLQRVGRVNRVGTKHENVYIFNFFPTIQASQHISLEDNIKSKIQAFHDMLGEDAKYLSDDEDITQHELFGDRLYKKLNSKETYEGEDAERSELEFLQVIRDIRDNDKALFERIKNLPRKARSHRQVKLNGSLTEAVVTFFRQGLLKRFYLASRDSSVELSFFDAVAFLECIDDDCKQKQRYQIPKQYFDLLKQNKEAFRDALTQSVDDAKPKRGGGKKNRDMLLNLMTSLDKRILTDDEEDYLERVIRAFRDGIVTDKTTKTLKEIIEKQGQNFLTNNTWDTKKILHLLKANVANSILYTEVVNPQQGKPREVILSAYLTQITD
ncbi:MAG: helicase-related protein [Phototrophicaceae bacterium]